MVIKRIVVTTLVSVLGLAVAGTIPVRAAAVPGSAEQWSMVSSPNVPGQDNVLQAVSCTTSAFCMAVGQDFSATQPTQAPLSEAWNGSTFRVVGTPNPLSGGQGDADLLSVSCTTKAFCIAVGWANSVDNGLVGIVDQWNGSTWTMTSPGGILLTSVSCVNSTFCMTVGQDGAAAVTFRWNGASWTQSASTSGTLSGGVACTSVSFCMAIGSEVDQWNGAHWTADAPQSNQPNSFIACATSSFCLGSETLSSIQQWNGSVWRLSTAGTSKQDIGAISCVSAVSCMAVGDVEVYNGIYRTFTEHWNGATWTVMSSANSPRNNDGLLGVACTSATFCVAVGFHDSFTTQKTLVETLTPAQA